MSDFLIKNEPVGRLNALVKKIGGLDVMKGILNGTIKFAITAQEILVCILKDEKIKVGATTGEETIAAASDVFDWIDPDFENWGTNVPSGKATEAASVKVYEMHRDATFEQMFGSLGDIEALCLEQGQVVNFCRENRGKLRLDGWATFVPFKVEGCNEPFVARVCVGGGGLKLFVDRLGSDNVWSAAYRHRVVVPTT